MYDLHSKTIDTGIKKTLSQGIKQENKTIVNIP